MVDQVKNFVIGTVSTGYDDSDTTIVLNSGHNFPDPSGDNYNVVWYDSTNHPNPNTDPKVEIVRITALSTNTVTVTRNQESSGASTKNTSSATYKMILSPTAKLVTDLQSEIDSDITTHTAIGDAHHTESHTVVSHSDTTATGAELETLTDGSNADTLHAHLGSSPPSDIAYDATSWNTNTDSATKNSIRDKIETMDTAIGLNTSKVTNATHSGEVTGDTALTIADDAVTYAKIQNVSADERILGNVTAIGSPVAELTKSDVLTMLNVSDGADVTGSNAPQAHKTSHTDGSDDIQSATNTQKGVATAAHIQAIEANTSKNTNVSTVLSIGTVGVNTVSITSDGGADDVTLPAATVAAAGMLTTAKWAEIVANNSKDTNVSTNLSEGTSTETTVDVNSSDGTNATLVAASTSRAGLLTKVKFDEIVVNNAKDTNATHSGEVTGSEALTITDAAVTYAKIQNVVSDDVLLGRISGADGDVEEITKTNVLTLLNVDDGADVTADNAPQTHAMSTHTDEGALATLSTVGTTQIDSDAVTYDKIQNTSATDKLLWRSTAGAGTIEEITCTAAGRAILDDADASAQRGTLDVDQAGTDNSTDVTLNASAITGGLSISTQEISHRAATNAQTGYMTDALVTNIETNNAKDTNATHTGDVTGDGALTIAAGAVDIAMLANGTDGELITWDAAGAPDTVAVGTATHVLTSNGVGVAPTFQAAGAGSSTVNIYLSSESAYLPNTSPATLTEELGSTTFGGYSTLDFDDSTDELAIFRTPVPDYDGGNIIFKFYWFGTPTTGDVAWSIKSIGVTDGEEIVAAIVGDLADVTADTVAGTTLDLNITTHSTYNPSGVSADDFMIIEIMRDVSRDDMAADARLLGILLEYTRA